MAARPVSSCFGVSPNNSTSRLDGPEPEAGTVSCGAWGRRQRYRSRRERACQCAEDANGQVRDSESAPERWTPRPAHPRNCGPGCRLSARAAGPCRLAAGQAGQARGMVECAVTVTITQSLRDSYHENSRFCSGYSRYFHPQSPNAVLIRRPAPCTGKQKTGQSGGNLTVI